MHASIMPNDEFLTVKEAAALLGLQIQTIGLRIRKKRIESQKDASGRHRIPRREIDRLLKITAGVQDVFRQITELYRSGTSMESVGKQFGMTRQDVRYRLVAAGIPRRDRTRRKLTRERISKERLEKLYLDDKLSIPKIAAEFSVCKHVIEQTLQFYQTPKRQPIKKGGYIVDALRSLKTGEKDTIKLVSKGGQGSFGTSAKRLGIKLSVKKLDVNKFEITRIG